jgi:D-sedoheptulose 7-phosphate isomerase
MNKLEEIFQQTSTAAEYADSYLKHLSDILKELDTYSIAAVIELFQKARVEGKNIFFIGNGGSAATASHFANDIAIGTRTKNRPFRIFSLTDNAASMTAIGNDYGFENIFVKQLEAVFNDGDLLVAISASGNSPNLLNAVEYVKSRNGITVGLTGFDGGKLKELSDYSIHIKTDKGEYGPVEDVHMVLDHVIGTYLMYQCRDET